MVAARAMRQAGYRLKMREVLESQANLKIKQAEVAELILEGTQLSAFSAQPEAAMRCGDWLSPVEERSSEH